MEYLNKVITDTIDKLQCFLKEDITCGNALTYDNTIVLPVQKITTGFVTGAFDMKTPSKYHESINQPISSVGGGITATPVGFLVISNGKTNYIKVDSEYKNTSLNDMLHKLFDRISKNNS
ncbi:MAG: GerW family sporulation protein [Christensenellaceae bacterium]|jgi:uncharacterized spore protein YtfJ|nr:GerW family sporulation protein [Christensenellaceae bacterium]